MEKVSSGRSSEEVASGEDSVTARVMLWTCPRSLSTAFTRSVTELSNVEVFNEEFTTGFYCGPERNKDPRFKFNVAPSHSYEAVRKRLEANYPDKVAVFGKDFAYPLTIGHLDMLPRGFFHTFLIRDPVKVFPSLKKRLEASRVVASLWTTDLKYAMPVKGYTYRELRELYDHIKGLGLPTLVIDAADLVEDPVEMMRYYCNTTGLPFKESMVTWEPMSCGNVSWHCSRFIKVANWMMQWYDGALSSSGYKKPTPQHVDVESFPPDVKEAIKASQPHYDYLFAQRVKLDSVKK